MGREEIMSGFFRMRMIIIMPDLSVRNDFLFAIDKVYR